MVVLGRGAVSCQRGTPVWEAEFVTRVHWWQAFGGQGAMTLDPSVQGYLAHKKHPPP